MQLAPNGQEAMCKVAAIERLPCRRLRPGVLVSGTARHPDVNKKAKKKPFVQAKRAQPGLVLGVATAGGPRAPIIQGLTSLIIFCIHFYV